MKLGEAILERDFLEELLERLGLRLQRDSTAGRPVNPTLLEIERSAKRRRDVQMSIDWTLQQLTIEGMTLGSYFSRVGQLEDLIDLLENADSPDVREKVEDLLKAKKETEKLIETVKWAQDLLIPEIRIPEDQPELKEEN